MRIAELLNEASLIIWDEGPMAHKFCFEALDQSLRDIIKAKSSPHKIFGGKVMVFGGDFRQILYCSHFRSILISIRPIKLLSMLNLF